MAKWKQSGEFTNQTAAPVEAPPVVEAPTSGTSESGAEAGQAGSGKKGILGKISDNARVIIILCVIVVALAIFFAWQGHANKKHMDNPGNPADDITQQGGDGVIGNDVDELFASVTPVFTYTSEELEQLRAWGYTGDEIEAEQLKETPAADLVAASKQAQEEARAALSNPESPEYQALLNQTWLGEVAVTVPVYDPETSEVGTTTLTLNADYEKMPAHGTNLFLRVKLEDGSHHFMEVSPYRYSQLADSGNIVVTYDYLLLDGKVFINNMREKQVE